MDYKGWILSIYDEYNRRYNNESNKLNSKNFKETMKVLFMRKNLPTTILILIYSIGTISSIVLYLLGKIERIEIYTSAWLIFMVVGLLPQWYKYEVKLDSYKKSIDILKDVLDEQGLKNPATIKLLLNETGNIFYKIKNVNFNFFIRIIFGVVSLIIPVGINNLDISNELFKSILYIVAVTILLLIEILLISYFALVNVPNNRIIRRKNFNELLKILLVYEIAKEKEKELVGSSN